MLLLFFFLLKLLKYQKENGNLNLKLDDLKNGKKFKVVSGALTIIFKFKFIFYFFF
jgi:hypothetical protein